MFINLENIRLNWVNSEFVKNQVTFLISQIKEVANHAITTQNLISTSLLLSTPILTLGLPHLIMRYCQNHYISPAAPTRIIPDTVWKILRIAKFPGDILLMIPYQFSRLFVSEKTADFLVENIIGPVYEEIEGRWFTQHICLTVVPALVLKYISPGSENSVYSLSAKVVRVILSAGIFALSHTDFWGRGKHSRMGVNGHFISGLLYGGLREYTGSIYSGSVAHIAHNIAVDLLS